MIPYTSYLQTVRTIALGTPVVWLAEPDQREDFGNQQQEVIRSIF